MIFTTHEEDLKGYFSVVLVMRLIPKYSIATVSHLSDESPPASPHSECEVRVELEEVLRDVGDVRQEARGREGAGHQTGLIWHRLSMGVSKCLTISIFG